MRDTRGCGKTRNKQKLLNISFCHFPHPEANPIGKLVTVEQFFLQLFAKFES